jgi:hypothetical protein
MNCQFSSVDFSFTFLCECEFIEMNLTKIKFKGIFMINPKTEKITFSELEFDKTEPIRIKITNSLSFPK